ncbi:tRNA (adenosine(37)-N6)-threonylcarbamoyltransferase complex ATPase subunit type 1 TsaE [Tropicimonas sp. IMCC34043]|uniref:tRNA (adenosine(37)-N6)-threonylcarbamoyltransferase complex ATPase subunit type 1 TsaE n=1 Tax=Tropicimonas sp. IMCC34043 TaxID=2248760 RepID=UPI000E27C992|nr:tRNA (adenosine(37)-N6)-threonylcarbamoyltransferase complex ATPase subunit type 1 TsaE [Tropicimonas sp. IMCC34043]
MTATSTAPVSFDLALPDPGATDAFGRSLAERLEPGDCLLLSGPIGAGKSHLARAIIRALLDRAGAAEEDIPSPTYTLVQTYEAAGVEIWHADLYRLSAPDELFELGLDAAFDSAICLIEWPDRLGTDAPSDALTIALSPTAGDGRLARLSGSAGWAGRLAALQGLEPVAR